MARLRLAYYAVAVVFPFASAFQHAETPRRLIRSFPETRIGLPTCAPAVVTADVAEGAASGLGSKHRGVWLDSDDAEDAIDIFTVTTDDGLKELSYFSIETFFPVVDLPPPGPSMSLRRALEDLRKQQLRLWRSRYGLEATKPAALLVARRRVPADAAGAHVAGAGAEAAAAAGATVGAATWAEDEAAATGEVVGMVSLSVQAYRDLDQSGRVQAPPQLGQSFVGQALGQLGASLRRAVARGGDPADAGVTSETLLLGGERGGFARSGGAPVPVLANLAVAPAARRRGLGQRLGHACEEIAAEWGFSELALTVDNDNASAQQLYAKTGYQVIMDARIPTTKAEIRGGKLYPYTRTSECAMAKGLR